MAPDVPRMAPDVPRRGRLVASLQARTENLPLTRLSGAGPIADWPVPRPGHPADRPVPRPAARRPARAPPQAGPAMLGSQHFSADFPVIRGQGGGHYHVSLLTYGKTRGCNFIYVILAPQGAGLEPTGFWEGGGAL